MSDFRPAIVRAVCAIGVSAAVLTFVSAQQPHDTSLYAGLRWRMLGPFRGGRVDAVSGVPGRPHEFYFGSVNGGVWKTVNAGRTWTPMFDAQPVASIGALAVAPSNPDIVYVGSGESTLRDSVGYGNGVYKSIDAGKTWTHIGLDDTQHIGRVAIDPKNPDVVFVAAIGHFYGPHPERGVYRSKDGGKTWQKVLYKNDSVGAVDVAIDPVDSQVIYASLWNTRRPPWYAYAPSNGPGGGIYKSIDGGATWKPLTTGLPSEGFGRSGIAIAPSNPKIVYAVIDAREGGLFRSNDAGATWTKPTGDTRVWGRGWYFEKVAVDAKNPEIVLVPNVGIQRSTDGGKTFSLWAYRGSPGGDDYHQLWVNPSDPNIMIVASDQGAIITLNGMTDTPAWSSWLNQPTAQIYRVSADYRFPYWVTGAQQDSGAVGVRTRGKFGSITMRDWEPLCAGGEIRRNRQPLRSGCEQPGRERVARAQPARAGAPRLDAAARVLESRSARALLREPVHVQDDGRWPALGAHQRRSHASGSRRPTGPRCNCGGDHRSQRQARRHLHNRAVAAAGADGLGRHRRRGDPRDGERRPELAECHAAGRHGVEPRDDDRRVAFRFW
ncbi:MAG: hypothetical protein DMF91_09595 [Acidobacteria bacterium]|nr:MAG: hypothetical protein DMF91_09595 [Acidobacteriota bacterium]